MNEPSHIAFRVTTLLFAALLGLQCVWLLLAELSRPGIDRLPTDASAAAAAAAKRNDVAWAASIGVVRGELWAEAAFTYANLLFGAKEASTNADQRSALARVRTNLDRALGDAPLQSGAWLLFAGLALRYPSLDFDAAEALKMSYYTGPSEESLVLPRLRTATYSDKSADVEMRQFVDRDLRGLLSQKQGSAIAEVYNDASPTGKHLIEQAIADVDPSAINLIRSGAQRQLPD